MYNIHWEFETIQFHIKSILSVFLLNGLDWSGLFKTIIITHFDVNYMIFVKLYRLLRNQSSKSEDQLILVFYQHLNQAKYNGILS